MRTLKTFVLTSLIIGVYLLHQDFWNWKKAEPLVFGFAWPRHLEETQPKDPPKREML
jgi:hypothetical protein